MKNNTLALLIILICILPLSAGELEAGEGIDFTGGEAIQRICLAEPLGEAGFHFAIRAQFLNLAVDTSTFDLRSSMAYGILPGFDFALYLPYMRMTSGAYSKYGSGDAVLTMKFLRGRSSLRPFCWGFQVSVLVPTGYQKQAYGFPPFSQNAVGYGGRFLFQLESKKIKLIGNVGPSFTESGNNKELFYGLGLKVNILREFLQMTGEFTSTHDFLASTNSASFAFMGAESHLPYVGIGLLLGAEAKLKEDRPLRLVVGVSLTSRKTLPGISKGILDTKRKYKKLMVFDFQNEIEGFMGDDIKERVCRELGSLPDITIMEPTSKTSVEKALRDRESALIATKDSGADLLIFTDYYSFGYNQENGFMIPFLLGFPSTEAYISADLWVVDTESKEEIFSGRVVGRASKLRGVVLFPTSRNSDTYLLNAVQMEEIRNQAIDRLVKNMGVIFSSKLK